MQNFEFYENIQNHSENTKLHLSLQHRISYFDIAIIDINIRKYIYLARTSNSNISEKLKEIQNKFNENNIFSISLSFLSEFFCVLPDVIYNEKYNNNYLKYIFNKNFNNYDVISTQLICNNNLHCIFAIDKSNSIIFNALSQKIKYYHSLQIIDKYYYVTKEKTDNIFINFHDKYFEFYLQNPFFYNIYYYQTSDDVLYHVFNTLRLIKRTSNLNIILAGEIEKDSQIYEKLNRYINTLTITKNNNFFEYSTAFSEISLHRFHSLFNQYLCEL